MKETRLYTQLSLNIWTGRWSCCLLVAKSSWRQSQCSVKRRPLWLGLPDGVINLHRQRRRRRPEALLRDRKMFYGSVMADAAARERRKSGAKQCNCVVVCSGPFATSTGTTCRDDPHFVFRGSFKPPWTPDPSSVYCVKWKRRRPCMHAAKGHNFGRPLLTLSLYTVSQKTRHPIVTIISSNIDRF